MATLYENIIKRVKDSSFVQFVDGKLLYKGGEITINTDGGGGGGGTGGTGQNGTNGTNGTSSFTHIRYAEDVNGTGFSSTPNSNTKAVAFYITTVSDYTPILSDFSGKWILLPSTGTQFLVGDVDPTVEGITGAMYLNKTSKTLFGPKTATWPTPGVALGGGSGSTIVSVTGYRYQLGASTAESDPGAGWIRFNSTTFNLASLTEMYINSTTNAGQNILDILATWGNEDVLTFVNYGAGTQVLSLAITSVTPNASGVWYSVGIQYKGGNSLTAFNEYIIDYTKVNSGTELMNTYNFARIDANDNLIDKNNVNKSGIRNGTYAQLELLNMTDFNKEYFLVNGGPHGQGMRYRGNGVEPVSDNIICIYNNHPKFRFVFPNTQATAIANNGGKVQITAAAHLLTAAEVTPAGEPASVYISAWGGTGVAGWYEILSRDGVDTFTIDYNYNSAFGVPTVAQKNVQIALPFSINIGKLGLNTEIRIDMTLDYTDSATAKQIFTRLNNTQFSGINQNTALQVTTAYSYGFRNTGSKTAQETLFVSSSGNDTGQSGEAITKMTENTAVDATINLRCLIAVANETMCIRHIKIYREF